PNPPATNNTVSQNDHNLGETIKFLSDELKQVQQRHEDEQKKIEQKFKTCMTLMNETCLLIQQSQATEQTMVRAMNAAISQSMFGTYMKLTEQLHFIVVKLKAYTKNDEYDELLQQINLQVQFLTKSHTEYLKHQDELKSISIKQTQALNQIMDSFLRNGNG
ncbi:unnamed protein product, partial [Didymodactylos carnosus]